MAQKQKDEVRVESVVDNHDLRSDLMWRHALRNQLHHKIMVDVVQDGHDLLPDDVKFHMVLNQSHQQSIGHLVQNEEEMMMYVTGRLIGPQQRL